ncbi:hypothetical protein HK096_005619, partial [Nowakowskiella sp. JEL0078]
MASNVLFNQNSPSLSQQTSQYSSNSNLQFTQFDYSQQQSQSSQYAYTPTQLYSSLNSQQGQQTRLPAFSLYAAFSSGDYIDEEPLLTELGIDFAVISSK